MKAIEMETVIDADGKLPEAFHEVFGRKARVIVLYQDVIQNDSPESEQAHIMELAGKIHAFRDMDDPLAYQKALRDEWRQE